MKPYDGLGVVIAAGGTSSRFGAQNKLLTNLGDIPVLVHALMPFVKLCRPENIVVVCLPQDLVLFQDALDRHFHGRSFKVVEGGATRVRSVWNGLCAIKENVDYLAVHDGARPLVSSDLVSRVFRACRNGTGAAVPAKRVNETVKRANEKGCVAETVPRECLWTVETPQIFRKDILVHAYQKSLELGVHFTDDAGIVEYQGHDVMLVEYAGMNTKVTYKEDVVMCEMLLARRSEKI